MLSTNLVFTSASVCPVTICSAVSSHHAVCTGSISHTAAEVMLQLQSVQVSMNVFAANVVKQVRWAVGVRSSMLPLALSHQAWNQHVLTWM